LQAPGRHIPEIATISAGRSSISLRNFLESEQVFDVSANYGSKHFRIIAVISRCHLNPRFDSSPIIAISR
jgi:hypothetical protein